MNVKGVGTQLYVWTQILGRDGESIDDCLDETLAEVAEAGLDGAEGWLRWAESEAGAREIKAVYDAYGLRVLSLYTGGAYHDPAVADATISEIVRQAEIARSIGVESITTNPNPIGRDKTDDELKTQANTLNRLGEALRALDMRLLVHNHDPEIRNDAHEYRQNLALTDPACVDFCVDTHWIYRGGGDPVELLRLTGSRAKSLHLRNSVGGVWSETFGNGDIDHEEIRATLDEIDFDGWLILELAYDPDTQITRSLKENARIGRDYIRDVFGT